MLRATLVGFSGKRTPELDDLVEELPIDDALAEALIDLAADSEPSVQAGATWVLWQHLSSGFVLGRKLVEALAAALGRVTDPWARLHVCRMVAVIEVPEHAVDAVAGFLRHGVGSEHKFLRAWAIDGMHRLALQHPRLVDEAERCLQRGADDEAASVRARVRNILRER